MSLGLHVSHSEGTSVWFDGLTITVKVAADQTGGSMGLVTASIPPGTGPSTHAHPDADETFYVIDGELEFLAGDRIFTGRPGDAVYIPRTTRHHVKNVGILPAR